jgi:hypothetical protein
LSSAFSRAEGKSHYANGNGLKRTHKAKRNQVEEVDDDDDDEDDDDDDELNFEAEVEKWVSETDESEDGSESSAVLLHRLFIHPPFLLHSWPATSPHTSFLLLLYS